MCALGAALLASPALAGGNYGHKQKAHLHTQLVAVQVKLARARAQESRLNGEVGGLTAKIGRLDTRVGDVAGHQAALAADLALRHRRIDVLNALYRVETSRVRDLQAAYRVALGRLDARLVAIYETPEPGTIDLALQAKSFQDLLDELNYLGLIANEDKAIAQAVADAEHRVALARVRTAQVKHRVANEANLINARLEQVAVIHNELLTSKARLASARHNKSLALLLARAQERSAVKESNAIQAASAQLEARIRAAEAAASRVSTTTTSGDGSTTTTTSTPPGTAADPSQAGLIWPVNGPITSPFGPRWGGFHPGIDIGVPTGTPIHAAATGTVIYCGWESGYGNLVVIDHHNGIATAYAHQSRIGVTCNQDVSQGEVIGYVGCTGFCTGPHLHFEVRVNGTPVDPIGYLP
jgi:murein DD-endopeptidase MepM/ murein hydrolase activator NlpD